MKKIFTLFYSVIFSTLGILAQTDVISTKKGMIEITPVHHAAMVIEWNGKTIYIDPYGGAKRFDDFDSPDLVLITDIHGDHFNPATLKELNMVNTELVAPHAIMNRLGGLTFSHIYNLANGGSMKWESLKITAVPMYNLPEGNPRHPKGRGNGYILKLDDIQIYISGDTDDIGEMRKLKKIDVAFICMNPPFTMNVEKAASAVLDFQPAVVYPFHYRMNGGKFSDLEKFHSLVHGKNSEIEVRIRDWYGDYEVLVNE